MRPCCIMFKINDCHQLRKNLPHEAFCRCLWPATCFAKIVPTISIVSFLTVSIAYLVEVVYSIRLAAKIKKRMRIHILSLKIKIERS
jgi:hypothetical protein